MTGADEHGGKRRALVVASQTRGLNGCHNDADLVASLFQGYGFEIIPLRGATATRAGILDAYESLIEVSAPNDTVVVYYAGHGSRATAQPPVRPTELRFIMPTDIDETDASDFRGILADELSILQWRLTMRTTNVTTLLDCCYSSRMSRDDGPDALRARGWDATWPVGAAVRRWRAAVDGFRRLHAAYPGSDTHDANPLAVRMVACGSHERAYEGFVTEFGAVHGLFTAALVAALRSNPVNTWDAIGERVRHQVLARIPIQRPAAEGPVHRVAFTVTERDRWPSYPVRVDSASGLAWLDGAGLYGIEPGDTFLLAAPGQRPEAATAPTAMVTGLHSQAALLARPDGAPVANGTTAYTWRQANREQLAVGIRAHEGEPVPRAIQDALAELTEVRTTDDPVAGGIATVSIRDGRYLLSDAAARPLYRASRPADAAGARHLRADLIGLATSLRLQNLDPTLEGDEFPAPVSLVVSSADGPVADETVLHVGDRLRIRVGNGVDPSATVYANVLDLGVAGRITILNTAEPAGIALLPGEGRTLGAGPEGHGSGIPLSWPSAVPVDGPRFESIVAVFSDHPQDLRNLGQDGITERGHRSRLARLMRRDRRDLGPTIEPARHLIRRVTILLCAGGPTCTHRFRPPI